MYLTLILKLLESFLYCVGLFFVGRILNQPLQLRRFLGIRIPDEKPSSFKRVNAWVQSIGTLLIFIAIVSFLTALTTTILAWQQLPRVSPFFQ